MGYDYLVSENISSLKKKHLSQSIMKDSVFTCVKNYSTKWCEMIFCKMFTQ